MNIFGMKVHNCGLIEIYKFFGREAITYVYAENHVRYKYIE